MPITAFGHVMCGVWGSTTGFPRTGVIRKWLHQVSVPEMWSGQMRVVLIDSEGNELFDGFHGIKLTQLEPLVFQHAPPQLDQ